MSTRVVAVQAVIWLVASTAPVCAASTSLLYGGRAFGAHINVSPVPATFVSDTGDLPSAGGALDTTATEVLLDNVFSAGFMSAQVYSTDTGINGFAQTVGLSVLLGTPAALTASSVSSRALAICGGTVGGVSATDLVFGGTTIQLTGPNQMVTIPGIATLTINERIDSITPGSSYITINALHLVLASGGEVIVSSSHAEVSNCPSFAVQPIPWSRVKLLYR